MNLKESLFEARNSLMEVIQELDKADGLLEIQKKIEEACGYVEQAEDERQAMLAQMSEYIRDQE